MVNTKYGKAEDEDFLRNVKRNSREKKGITVVETGRKKGQVRTYHKIRKFLS